MVRKNHESATIHIYICILFDWNVKAEIRWTSTPVSLPFGTPPDNLPVAPSWFSRECQKYQTRHSTYLSLSFTRCWCAGTVAVNNEPHPLRGRDRVWGKMFESSMLARNRLSCAFAATAIMLLCADCVPAESNLFPLVNDKGWPPRVPYMQTARQLLDTRYIYSSLPPLKTPLHLETRARTVSS
jgi:hypothetical protein